ncbi:hypothetical protein [Paraburkholderia fynbosensis]|nr:hypothetical protein [Paraburkholderia fynbosensis]
MLNLDREAKMTPQCAKQPETATADLAIKNEASISAEDQAVLSAFSEPAALPGGPLWVTLLSDRTIEALWREDPARQALQIEAALTGTCFYMMGLATRTLTIDPHAAIVQDGHRYTGRIVNIAYLNGQQVPKGNTMLGLLEFTERVDIARPFEIEFSTVTIKFSINRRTAEQWGNVSHPGGRGF